MNYFSNQQGFFYSSINLLLTVYLCLALIGCGKPPQPPTTEQVHQLGTRVFDGNYDVVFKATMNTLQDMGYSIDNIDKESGLITAERYSESEFAKIFSTEKEIPTWMWVACIVTGAIVLAVVVLGALAVVGAFDDDDNDKDKKEKKPEPKKGPKDKGLDTKEGKKKGGKKEIENERRRKEEQKRKEEEKRREEGRKRPHKKRSSSTTTTILDLGINLDFDPPQEEYYYYKMTLNLKELENDSTNVRISLQGSHIEGEEVKETGSVYDARFFELFFANLNQALKIEKGEVTP